MTSAEYNNRYRANVQPEDEMTEDELGAAYSDACRLCCLGYEHTWGRHDELIAEHGEHLSSCPRALAWDVNAPCTCAL